MKHKIRPALVVLFLFIIITAEAGEKQKPEWKGKIEYENGVKVIKNPQEPLYGEIVFELEEDLSIGSEEDENYMFYRLVRIAVDSGENIFVLDIGNCRIQKFDKDGNYLQTIGRKGQGPGEFERPFGINLDSGGNIYVLDRTKIHIFSKEGEYVKTIKSFIFPDNDQFLITSEGNILAQIRSPSPEGRTSDIGIIGSNGKRLKTIASYPLRVTHIGKGGIPKTLSSPWDPRLYFCSLDESLGIYGYSSEYKLHIIDSSGNATTIIEKEEPPEPITRKEKNRIIEGYLDSYKKRRIGVSRGTVKKAFKFPPHKPFFIHVMSDDKGRIYVGKRASSSSSTNRVLFDLFSKQGYYIYRIKMSHFAHVIKDGFIFRAEHDRETGYVKVKRYKIKNWDQIISDL